MVEPWGLAIVCLRCVFVYVRVDFVIVVVGVRPFRCFFCRVASLLSVCACGGLVCWIVDLLFRWLSCVVVVGGVVVVVVFAVVAT